MQTDVEREFEHAGLTCVVMRVGISRAVPPGFGSSRNWRCGYVRVGRDHPWHGRDCCWGPYGGSPEEIVDVHGGLNYAGMWPRRESCRGGWWFGFDCNHVFDLRRPKSAEYVSYECRRLADQLSAVGTCTGDARA